MAFYSDVIPGERFTPSAALSNDVRHLINGLNGFGGNQLGGNGSGRVRVQAYNASGIALPQGTAVGFDNALPRSGDAVPAIPVRDLSKPWGVIAQALKPGEIGDCFISGPVNVRAYGTGDYAKPHLASPDMFVRGSDGAPVLHASGIDAVVNLGAGTPENYSGPFAVTYDSASGLLLVSPGYLSRNGEFVEVAGTELEPQDGLVCVESILGNGEWSAPEIKFGIPSSQCFPLAGCAVTADGDSRSVSVCQFRVPVAIIIVAAECPLSAEADDDDGQQ